MSKEKLAKIICCLSQIICCFRISRKILINIFSYVFIDISITYDILVKRYYFTFENKHEMFSKDVYIILNNTWWDRE